MKKKWIDITEFLLLLGILFFLNVIFSNYFFRLDFTEDKRYSISDTGKEMLRKLDDVLYVTVFLDGDLNPGYTRLKKAIEEKLQEFKAYAGNNIQVTFSDPNAEQNPQLRDRLFYQLSQRGIKPKYYLEEKGGTKQEKYIFPGAIISYKEKETPVMFLKGSKILPEEQQLNQSVEVIEFELLSAIRKLSNKEFKSIAIIEGHGELKKEEIADLTNALNENYAVERININDEKNLDRFHAILVAKPEQAFTDLEKFKIDQFIMKGGNALFFIDALDVRKDSLQGGETFALIRDLNIEDLLFRYGARLNQDLVQDLNCGVIKVATGLNGEVQALNFPYYPILYNFSKHPIVKSLDAVYGKFSGTIDTVKADGITKTPLILTSDKTRTISAPSQIDLDQLRKDAKPENFAKSYLPVAVLLEGQFKSLYANRPSLISGYEVVKQGKGSKVLVCSDGDLPRNEYNPKGNLTVPLGYDAEMRYMFSNKDFVLNAVDYLMNEELINVRAKEIALRPLDKVRIIEERTHWQVLNLLVPVVLIIAFAVLRFFYRKKKFESFK
ncbi:MAG TPA: gliding motility-associated ABC transporter substrate-binding protein GldG [Cytophagaceae bacterium]